MAARDMLAIRACVPESASVASDPPSVCLHLISWVRCCEWMEKEKKSENKITMLCRMGMLHQREGIYYCQIMALVFIFLFLSQQMNNTPASRVISCFIKPYFCSCLSFNTVSIRLFLWINKTKQTVSLFPLTLKLRIEKIFIASL